MKKSLLIFLFFLVLFLGGDSFQTQAKKKTKDRYKLVFCDEFNLYDGSQPDTAIWSSCHIIVNGIVGSAILKMLYI